METEQKNNRWFLIKHRPCGAFFSIESQTFTQRAGAFRCPNCGELIIDYISLDGFMEFFKHYNGAKKVFKDFTIRQLKPKSKEET